MGWTGEWSGEWGLVIEREQSGWSVILRRLNYDGSGTAGNLCGPYLTSSFCSLFPPYLYSITRGESKDSGTRYINPSSLLICCVTSGKSPNFSGLQSGTLSVKWKEFITHCRGDVASMRELCEMLNRVPAS